MTRFIAVPKENVTLSVLSMAEIGFSKTARNKQIRRLKSARRRVGGATARVKQVTRALKKMSLEAIADPAVRTPLTDITILDLDRGDLAQLREAMPDHDIIEDTPLNLVPPTKTGPTLPQAQAGQVDTWHLEAVQVLRARQSGFTGRGAGVGVAILDTGIEEVPEIHRRITSAFRHDPDTKQVSTIDTVDTQGHGTHVAGIVCGQNVGVAPEADLMNYIMIPNARGNISDFVAAVEFVATRPEISVLNMSAGIPHHEPGVVNNPAMLAAIRTLRAVGVLPVVAIGNEGRNTSRSPGNYVEVLSIGASNKRDKVANFSSSATMTTNNQSYTVPDLVAPGEAVTSCVMGGGYESWNGTSMATPVVSGLAALIIERYPKITEMDLRGELFDAVTALPNVPPIRQGEGLAQLPKNMWYQGS
jgi:subtilisin family serine protease